MNNAALDAARSYWSVVVGAMLAQLFTTGFYSYSFSFLILPLQEGLGATRVEVMYAMTGSTLAAFVLAPGFGALVDRQSPRLLMSIATLVYASGMALLSLSRNIEVFIVVFALTMAVANNLLGILLINPMLSRCFTATRGRALGIAALGASLGGFLVPPAFLYFIEHYGWRGGLQGYALTLVLLLLPALFLTIRNAPRPEAGVQRRSVAGQGAVLRFGAILARREYWLVGTPVALVFCTITVVLANFTPYLVGAGLQQSDAGRLLIAAPVGSMVGKLLFGHVADRFDKKLLLQIALILMMGGVLLITLAPSRVAVLMAMLMLSTASGGTGPTWGALLPEVFGLASYGRVMGAMSPLITLTVTAGLAFAGVSFDATGSYEVMLYSFAGVLCVAVIMLGALDVRNLR